MSESVPHAGDRAGRSISGIVLAGGRSSRFGSDKLAAQLDGRPLLHHAISAVAEIADEVVVVVGSVHGAPELPEACRVPLRVARDPEPHGGPLIGLIAGLEAARFPIAIVVGGDMPLVVGSVLAALVDRLGPETPAGERGKSEPAHRIDAAGLLDDGRIRPLPCVLRREPALGAAPAMLAGGTSRLRALFEALGAVGIPEGEWRLLDPEAHSLFDIDSPEDLAQARRATESAGESPPG